jgi:pyrroline-5-carboxylate reductase
MEHLGIIGTGNMGGALAQGAGDLEHVTLYGFDPSRERLQALEESCGLIPCEHLKELCTQATTILVAVKPHLVPQVLEEMRAYLTPDTCLVSIAAGVTLERLKQWSNQICPVIRVMPNTPALVGQGVFAVCLEDERLTPAHKTFVMDLLNHMGSAYVLEERLFDAFTGLIGSGPAYVFHFMEGLIDAGVSLGLGRQQATDMVKGLLTGSAQMAATSAMHITQLKEMVTSPGGTTMAGLNQLEKHACKHALYKAVKAAYDRSRELG